MYYSRCSRGTSLGLNTNHTFFQNRFSKFSKSLSTSEKLDTSQISKPCLEIVS